MLFNDTVSCRGDMGCMEGGSGRGLLHGIIPVLAWKY